MRFSRTCTVQVIDLLVDRFVDRLDNIHHKHPFVLCWLFVLVSASHVISSLLANEVHGCSNFLCVITICTVMPYYWCTYVWVRHSDYVLTTHCQCFAPASRRDPVAMTMDSLHRRYDQTYKVAHCLPLKRGLDSSYHQLELP
jgi:hypothetical protein